MLKRRVALLCDQNLLGESLEHILVNSEEVEFIGSWGFDEKIMARLADVTPELLLIADEVPPREQISSLTSEILTAYPEISIIRVTLDQNNLRVYTSHSTPARSAELVEIIRQLPFQSHEKKVSVNTTEEEGSEANAT